MEKAMAPQSSTLAWKIPCTEGPGRLQSMGFLRVGHNWASSLSLSCIGEGHGTPLQCSCLENPSDGGAWWAAVYGVAHSRAWLKRLSSSSSSSSSSVSWGFPNKTDPSKCHEDAKNIRAELEWLPKFRISCGGLEETLWIQPDSESYSGLFSAWSWVDGHFSQPSFSNI